VRDVATNIQHTPFDGDLELAVIDKEEMHSLVFSVPSQYRRMSSRRDQNAD
jgi:hypothetical protein